MKNKLLNKPKLRHLNDGLSVLLVLLALYIFFLPAVPQVTWWVSHSVPIISRSTKKAEATPAPATDPVPNDNRLVIPEIGLNEHIFTGQSIYTVNKGVWIRPNGSTPDKGSNTVFVGHRFTYTNPRGVFYYLDKIQLGDLLTVYWDGRTYTYKTTSISEVTPTTTSVESPSSNSEITLYTCTPLWSLKDRLVVVATLVETT